MNQRLRSANSLLAISGIVAPILFALAVIVLGFVREGYSHISQTISDLGEIGSPNMAGQNVNFILTGLLIVAFSFGLYRGTGPGEEGEGRLAAGLGDRSRPRGGGRVFQTTFAVPLPGCNSLAANGHSVAGFVVFPLIPLAILLFLQRTGAGYGLAAISYVLPGDRHRGICTPGPLLGPGRDFTARATGRRDSTALFGVFGSSG